MLDMAKILITGGTGLVGRHLIHALQKGGHEVVMLSRAIKPGLSGIKQYYWNISKGEIDLKAFEKVTHIVHLAGAGIADARWTEARKKEIQDSRVFSTKLLLKGIKESGIKPEMFVGASAIGYYGAVTTEKIFTETDAPARDFMGETCRLWEQSYEPLKELSMPHTVLRIGVVLAKDGGALQKMSAPFRYGLGAALGSGTQYMPWIHLDDLVQIILDALSGKISGGIYNAVATEYVTNAEFSKKLAQAMKKPFYLPNVPTFVMKLMLGEMAVMLLEGSRISNSKLLSSGFTFRYSSIEDAIRPFF
jgi:uncharacterized protein (TIGR01777 family)